MKKARNILQDLSSKKKSGAFRIAYMNGWLDEMIWLVRPTAKPIKWTKEAVFEESRKYFIVTEFMNNAVTAYTIAKIIIG